MSARYVIGAIVILVFMVWGASAFFKTTVAYVSIEQAKTATRTVQVRGAVDRLTVRYHSEAARLEFAIYDSETDNPATAERLVVVYEGTVPANFDQATGIVVKGKTQGEVFVAQQLLVKCPSKYQGEGGEEFQDIRKHRGDAGGDGT